MTAKMDASFFHSNQEYYEVWFWNEFSLPREKKPLENAKRKRLMEIISFSNFFLLTLKIFQIHVAFCFCATDIWYKKKLESNKSVTIVVVVICYAELQMNGLCYEYLNGWQITMNGFP